MRVLEAGDWSLLLPDEWSAEQDDEGIFIGDQDGIGCLEISELRHADGDFCDADMEQFREAGQSWDAVSMGSFKGRASALLEDNTSIREWYLYTANLLLFVTYSCELENRGMDDAAVDDILSTLRFMAE